MSIITHKKSCVQKKIGKIPFSSISFNSFLKEITNLCFSNEKCVQVIVANVYSVTLAEHNQEFATICEQSEYVIADGLPVVWASQILRRPILERIAGPDLMWKMTNICGGKNISIFLLGGRKDDLNRLKNNLTIAFPKLDIAGAYSPPFGYWSYEENEKIINNINSSNAKILWLGISTPKQDIWIARNKSRLDVKIAIGVGAAFDFYSGRVKRAPSWMRRIGLEWLYRLTKEPKRLWKRYLIGNVLFFYIVAKDITKKL
jgi:N-acetylglucosaminyldiphosphoundecaprenol N-acetyl-beta-D-mannosaminyltransferase